MSANFRKPSLYLQATLAMAQPLDTARNNFFSLTILPQLHPNLVHTTSVQSAKHSPLTQLLQIKYKILKLLLY